MIRLLILFIIIFSFTLSFCKKNSDPRLTNCDNLVNDAPMNDGAYVAIPNAFTPNGDGLNDQFKSITNKVAKFKLTVYDNKNNIVYSSQNISEGWSPSGNIVAGTKFYYRVEAEAQSGRKMGLCGELLYLSCIPKNIDISNLNFQDEVDQFGNFTVPTAELRMNCN